MENEKSAKVLCRACGYNADIWTYKPTASAYSDIRCPKCGSTDNQHNSDYQKEIFANIRNLEQEA